MFATFVILTLIAAAFWREALKLAIAVLVVLLVIGTVEVVQFVDGADIFTPPAAGESTE